MSTENIKTEIDPSPKPPTVDVGSLARGSASGESPQTDALESQMKIAMEPIDYTLLRFAREWEARCRATRRSRDYWHDREKDARELIADVLCGSVDAGVYPDGPCLDRELRARIKAYLSEPNAAYQPGGGEASTETKSNERKS